MSNFVNSESVLSKTKDILAKTLAIIGKIILGIIIVAYILFKLFSSDDEVADTRYFAESGIIVELDLPTSEKLEIAKTVVTNLLESGVGEEIRKANNYITPMAMDEGFELKWKITKVVPFGKESFEAVHIVCRFSHPNRDKYTTTVAQACKKRIEEELQKYY